MSFLEKYFITPILRDEGYNIFNTFAYAVLAILILYGTYALLKKLKVHININLFFAAIPFIAFGAITRSFVDHNFFELNSVNTFFLISPGIWLVSIAFFFASFFLSYWLHKKYKLSIWKITGLLGTIILLASIIRVANHLAFNQLFGAGLILVLFSVICMIIIAVGKYAQIRAYTESVGLAAITCQTWDAVNTSTILTLYGGTEKHVVPQWLINQFGPWSFLLVKLVILLPAVYLMHKYVEDELLKNTFLIGIAVFGLGEGLRNFVSMILV